MAKQSEIVLLEQIEPKVLTVRGQKVILDGDLAVLYGTSTNRLNEQVKRNKTRFPVTFMFTLTDEEKEEVVTNCDHLRGLKYSRVPPNAFTEHGVIMAASILNTSRAVDVSIFVVQAFVKLRQFAVDHQEILKKLSELERKVGSHDDALKQIVLALKQLMTTPTEVKPKRRIGFQVGGDDTPQARARARK